MKAVHTEKLAGKPVQTGQTRLIPIETTTRFQPPGMWGVLLWRRPTAVIVQHPDGAEEILPIQDATRQAQVALLAIGLSSAILMWIANRFWKNHP